MYSILARMFPNGLIYLFIGTLISLLPSSIRAQDTLGLKDGYFDFSTSNFNIKLVKDSQTLASLQPIGSTFDFSPFDYLSQRANNGNYHVGDLTFRYRQNGSTAWTDANTASARAPVTALTNLPSGVLAASDLKPTVKQALPVNITRQWMNMNGDLALSFTLTNTLGQPLEIGSLGFPIEFNSIFTNRPATDIQTKCSLQDPYIGLGAGYVQVTPQGTGSALVVTGLNSSNFEAWRFLPEATNTSLSYQSQVFEGFYEWQVHTKAWAENEWKNVVPWNSPTSRTLVPNQSMTVGLRFSLAKDGVRAIETTVKSMGVPYAVSVPGYIVSQDTSAKLFVSSNSSITNVTVDPPGAFTITTGASKSYTLQASPSMWGRARLTISYSDGRLQTLHYNIIKSAPTAVSNLGNFLTTKQWFKDTSDPFKRAPSVISYDRSVNQPVLQDPRVWIAGLSDEAGAGSWLAACMKQSIQPNAAEIKLLESFIDTTLWGTLQVNNGSNTYGVRKSVFFYEPARVPGYKYNSSINWSSWESWNYATAYSTSRAYDYVHVSAAYWAFYRVARAYPSLVSLHTYDWYLNQAFQTVMATTAVDGSGNYVVGYADDGLMEETVWGEILKDLYRENQTSNAQAFEARMKKRAQHWGSIAVPFGSEMAWDSTGQEGVYYWTKYAFIPLQTNDYTNVIQKLLRPYRHRHQNYKQYPRLHAYSRPLGLEWQCQTLLGQSVSLPGPLYLIPTKCISLVSNTKNFSLQLRRSTGTYRAPNPSLRLRPQLSPTPQLLPLHT